MVAADDSGRIVYCNPAAERLLGWSRQVLTGEPLTTIIPERLHQAHLHGLARYLRTHRSRLIGRPVRVPARRRDGDEVEVELSLSSFRSAGDGHVFVASLRDLSERVELERQAAVSAHLRATTEVAVRLGLSGEAESVDEAAPLVLDALGSNLGWDLGALWIVSPNGEDLYCVEVWRAPDVVDAGFDVVTRELRLSPGTGLPGRVWESGEPAWMSDVTLEAGFPRTRAAALAGLHGTFAFPILSGRTTLGVVEFFSSEVRPPDPDLLDVVSAVGRQLGQFIERKRAEAAARFRAALLAAEAEAAIEGVVALSPSGEILFWNQRLLDMIGTDAEVLRSLTSEGLLALVLPRLVDPDVLGEMVGRMRDHPRERARREMTLVDGRTLDCYSAPLGDEETSHYGRAWYLRDITEHKMAERRLSALAETLQASLIPPHAPVIPGLDVASIYRPARQSSVTGMEVGGDFYDLFPIKGTSWGFAIGDVCGKGAEAASLTALARYTIRAAAMRVRRPSQVLAALNDAVLRDDGSTRFLTVVTGFLRPGRSGADLAMSSGGHPLPLVVRSDGRVERAGQFGMLIGAFPHPELHDARVHLDRGDSIVLYTDGVTEARGPTGMLDDEGLESVLAAAGATTAAEMADRILEAVLAISDGEPRDDLAIIVVRVPDGEGATAGPAAPAVSGSAD